MELHCIKMSQQLLSHIHLSWFGGPQNWGPPGLTSSLAIVSNGFSIVLYWVGHCLKMGGLHGLVMGVGHMVHLWMGNISLLWAGTHRHLMCETNRPVLVGTQSLA